MLEYETKLWIDGVEQIAGIDEVGRGCLFGDVVAASVMLKPNVTIDGINDSKKLSPKKRDQLYDTIRENAVSIGIGRVDASKIDEINIKQASRLAMRQAVLSMEIRPEYLLIDAERIDIDLPQIAIIKGDQLSQSIAAASIIAKVTRDRLCEIWDKEYPEYGLTKHKGYATKLHREMIKLHGPTGMHRTSFLGNILQRDLFDSV